MTLSLLIPALQTGHNWRFGRVCSHLLKETLPLISMTNHLA